MITAIFVKTPTTLTFATSEDVFLEEMNTGRRTKLSAGQSTPVEVGSGLCRVQSKREVAVSASTAAVQIAITPEDKDGGNDPPKLVTLMDQLSPGVGKAMSQSNPRRFLFSNFGKDAP